MNVCSAVMEWAAANSFRRGQERRRMPVSPLLSVNAGLCRLQAAVRIRHDWGTMRHAVHPNVNKDKWTTGKENNYNDSPAIEMSAPLPSASTLLLL